MDGRERIVSVGAEPAADGPPMRGEQGMETENWYLKHKSRIMWEMRFILRHFKKHLATA